MEASVAGAAPAVADGGLAPTPAQPTAPQQPAAPAAPVQPQAPLDPAAPEGDVRAQLKAMEDRVAELQGQVQPQAQQPANLLDALAPEQAEDLGFTPEELAALQQGQVPGQVDPAEQEAQLQELDAFMQERIQKALEPIQQERQIDQIKSFQEKHPDIVQPEILSEVEATMQNAVERYGEGARYDTNLLSLAYTAAKAKQADAGAVPAEQAANHGASIETQAGQTQTGDPSAEEAYKEKVFGGVGSGGEAFR